MSPLAAHVLDLAAAARWHRACGHPLSAEWYAELARSAAASIFSGGV